MKYLKFFIPVFALFSLFFAHQNGFSQQKVGIQLNVSSLGIGGEIMTNITDNINVRTGGSYFTFDVNGNSDDYRYEGNVKLMTYPVLADWYPFGNAFHITAGGVLNFNQGNVLLTPSRSIEIDGRMFEPEELGNMTGVLEYSKFSPYFGIGIGNPLMVNNIGFSFNAGTMYQSSPTVKLAATELLSRYEEEHNRIETTIKEKMNYVKFYPVVSLSVSYKF